jgi:putative endonuclease
MFHTYILNSKKVLNKFYVGLTGDNLENRLKKHLNQHKCFTAKAKD